MYLGARALPMERKGICHASGGRFMSWVPIRRGVAAVRFHGCRSKQIAPLREQYGSREIMFFLPFPKRGTPLVSAEARKPGMELCGTLLPKRDIRAPALGSPLKAMVMGPSIGSRRKPQIGPCGRIDDPTPHANPYAAPTRPSFGFLRIRTSCGSFPLVDLAYPTTPTLRCALSAIGFLGDLIAVPCSPVVGQPPMRSLNRAAAPRTCSSQAFPDRQKNQFGSHWPSTTPR